MGGGGREGAKRAGEVVADDVELGCEVAALVVEAEGELPDEGERDGPGALGKEARLLVARGNLAGGALRVRCALRIWVSKTGNAFACRLRQSPANRISTTQSFAHRQFIDSDFLPRELMRSLCMGWLSELL